MAQFPLRVELDENDLAKLIGLYKQAYDKIIVEITSADDFKSKNRRAVLKQIDAILQELGEDTSKWINTNLPSYYTDGLNDAVGQLKFANVNTVGATFGQIHKEAVEALVDETSTAFGESLRGVSRSAKNLINQATQMEIKLRMAEGKITGETRKQISNAIKGMLKENGLDALVDKSGKKWTLDRYSEMLVRTKAVEARNTGMANKMLENGYDLVQVSAHGATDVCGVWEGQILSATGKTPGFKTVDDARGSGLFHPNCRHAINVIVPQLAKMTNAYGQVPEDDLPAQKYIYIKKGKKSIKYPVLHGEI